MTLQNFQRLAFVLIRNCLFGGNIASLRFILSPRKFATYQQACMDLWAVYCDIGLPSVSLSRFLNYKEDIKIGLWNIKTLDIMGSSTANMKDRLIFATIAKVTKPKVVFEIGTFRGESAANFALNTPEDAKIYTLDLPPSGGELTPHNNSQKQSNIIDRQIIKQRCTEIYVYESIEEGKKVVQLYGNSFDFDFRPYYNKIDLFLVDGAHNYAAVVKDTNNALSVCDTKKPDKLS